MTTAWRYPFGTPVGACRPSADGPRRAFLLGAYPSAVHVAWRPPVGSGRRVQALPIDDEPTPFWDGADARKRIDRWAEAVRFEPSWGRVDVPDRRFNGGSGRPIDRLYLEPLGLTREETWVTDCLDTYRASEGVSAAIASVYDPFASRVGLSPARLGHHPDENEVVAESQHERADRLVAELEVASPVMVVTLGNAALRVLRSLPVVSQCGSTAPTSLTPTEYGRPCPIQVGERRVTLWALGHPNIVRTNRTYAAAHDEWARQLPARASVRPVTIAVVAEGRSRAAR